jgi:hypothetical protein
MQGLGKDKIATSQVKEKKLPQALPRKLVHRLVTLNAMSSFLMGSLGFSIQLIKRDFELTRVVASWHNIGWAAALGLYLIYIARSRPSPACSSNNSFWLGVINHWFVGLLP